MANRVVVLAIFPDEAAADAAATTLKESGLAHDDADRCARAEREG